VKWREADPTTDRRSVIGMPTSSCRSSAGLDHAIGAGPEGVGWHLPPDPARCCAKIGQFYSADEYDLGVIERTAGEILELGRSCVDAQYRNRA